DGIPDLAVANYAPGLVGNDYLTTVTILLGNSDGSFRFVQTFGVGGSPLSLAVLDVNVDGIPDLAVSSYSSVHLFLGNGDGTFQSGRILSAGQGVNQLAVGDFNGDGIPDIVTANYAAIRVGLIRRPQ